ncbi:hypothetical protein I5770_09765 [Brucella sp. BO2]|uniref:hypothetical protein n=1 Tax=Brucella sp. BO2 TaxID=693750 RepID=UPI0012EA9C14|nr:hypothetical protein [Brucella sp. BO2]QPN28854.1 hypothetical protein I5770_09765 [Brucella sp. BO2]
MAIYISFWLHASLSDGPVKSLTPPLPGVLSNRVILDPNLLSKPLSSEIGFTKARDFEVVSLSKWRFSQPFEHAATLPHKRSFVAAPQRGVYPVNSIFWAIRPPSCSPQTPRSQAVSLTDSGPSSDEPGGPG